MKSFKIGVLRVFTTEDEKLLKLHGALLEKYFPQFETETRCIPEQPDGIFDEKTHREAVPKIIRLAVAWEQELDGLIVSCAGDPAVAELKELLSIPVNGAGRTTAAYSLTFGNRIGIIGIEADAPRCFTDVLGERNVGYLSPQNVRTTRDLLTESGREAVFRAGRDLQNRGADLLALACTGMATARIASELQQRMGIPVVDPVMAEGVAMLGQCLALYGGKRDEEDE